MGATVDGLVLDSLVPLQDGATADLSRHSLVADAVGRKILAGCDRGRCGQHIGEPLEPLYRRVLARAGTEPALLANVPGKDLKRFFGTLLDFPSAANRIPDMIKELDAGQDTLLREVVADVRRKAASMGSYPLVIHGDRDAKTSYDGALRHIEALRRAGPVKLLTDWGGGHSVLWGGGQCNADEVMQFVLGEEAVARCVSITFSH